MSYAELFCQSNFSFLEGASHPEELVVQASFLGYRALAITDECSVAGVVRAHTAIKDHRLPIKLIVGSFFRLYLKDTSAVLRADTSDVAQAGDRNGVQTNDSRQPSAQSELKVVLLCPDRDAYAELCRLITNARRRAEKGEYELSEWDLMSVKHCFVIWLPEGGESDKHWLAWMKKYHSERVWLGLQRHLKHNDKDYMQHCQGLACEGEIPLLACGGVLMHSATRLPLQHTITAIRHGTSVQEAGALLQSNTERSLRSIDKLSKVFDKECLYETLYVAQQCQFELDSLRYEYPQELVPQGLTAMSYLRQLVDQGIAFRFPDGAPPDILATIEKELGLIEELDYPFFFLTIHDVVMFAKQQGILYQGRGSAANSIVCYCLEITSVDPRQISVLFERFISKERNEPPDIDVDFEHQRREEVIQYIYQKYGRERAALAATVISYRFKSAVRDVGKALGIAETQLDFFIKNVNRRDRSLGWQAQITELGLNPESIQGQHFIALVNEIIGFPRHLSQHVGGFVISSGPLYELVPVENASMTDRTVIQWDKDDLESLGLLKVDVLALGMLSAIRKTFDLIEVYYFSNTTSVSNTGSISNNSSVSNNTSINNNTDVLDESKSSHGSQSKHGKVCSQIPRLSIAQITRWQDDPQVYRMIQKADTIGIFQIESRAQMSMLPRLKPATYYDLVIQIAIVRPGPIQGDMVHPFLKRRNGEEAVSYPSEAVKDVLSRTLGVPIFQEQVIKLAMVAAGFTGGEADQLRRAMASWKKNGELAKFRQKLINGMIERGYEMDFAERIYDQICGFGEYGFPESHSASFAVLAYVSAWLKYYYPAAFYIGLLNSLPMGFYSASQLVQDARRHGVRVLPVCVNHSERDHTLIKGDHYAMRLGFRIIKGMSQQAAERIVSEKEHRKQHKRIEKFNNIRELKELGLSAKDLDALASANAFSDFSDNRYAARWSLMNTENNLPMALTEHGSALNDQVLNDSCLDDPRFNDSSSQDAFRYQPSDMDGLIEDYAATGLSLNSHPISLLEQAGQLGRFTRANALVSVKHQSFIDVVGLVVGRQSPGTASGVTFMTLEDDTGNINVVVWAGTARVQKQAFLSAKVLKVKGILEREGEVVHVIAGKLTDMTYLLADLRASSRDFH